MCLKPRILFQLMPCGNASTEERAQPRSEQIVGGLPHKTKCVRLSGCSLAIMLINNVQWDQIMANKEIQTSIVWDMEIHEAELTNRQVGGGRYVGKEKDSGKDSTLQTKLCFSLLSAQIGWLLPVLSPSLCGGGVNTMFCMIFCS